MEKQWDTVNVMKPMHGAAYYPETWDEKEQEHDIEYMKKAGMNVMRIAEFAWGNMEPKEGKFDFTWLHKIVDKLADNGIAVIMGTPTAAPPLWLKKKDPKMMRLNANDLRSIHGGRREICSNNPTFRKYSARIVEKMAKEFMNDKNVIGWQIDNEINLRESGCFCEECEKGFRNYLKNKYGTIENLNKRWNLNIFSQSYEDFSEIQLPKRNWQFPQIMFEWFVFQTDSHIDFVHMQADILHKYVKVPVGTDMLQLINEDFEKMNEKLDVVQFNHYNSESTLPTLALWYDIVRAAKDRPFWSTETDPCWNGAVTTPPSHKPEGYCRLNAWMSIAFGGESNLYWLWRQHWAGGEQMHGAVLYASGRPIHTFPEIQQASAEYEKASEFITGTKVDTEIAIHLSTHNHLLQTVQPVVTEPGVAPLGYSGPAFNNVTYMPRVRRFHNPLIAKGVRPDAIGSKKSLDKYKLLISPCMMTLDIDNLAERIEKWVNDGGVWVVGPMTDMRDDIGAHYIDRVTGIHERMTGAVLENQTPDDQHKIKCAWGDGTEFSANTWVQTYAVPEDVEVIASVTGGHSTFIGKAVAFKKKVGKGTVIVVGTFPSAEDLSKIYDIAFEESGVKGYKTEGSIAVVPRKGEEKEGLFLLENGGKEGYCNIECEMTDVLTGEKVGPELNFKPYDMYILEK